MRPTLLLMLAMLALAAGASTPGARAATDERRVALVIGNDAYRNVSPLKKAINDARAVAHALQSIGFQAIERENVDRRGMNQALTEFIGKISGGGVGLLYYAGHGVQIAGSNYLLPVDVPALSNLEELRDETTDLGRILERLTEAKAKLVIVILDACRDNPFPKVAGRSIGGSRGLTIPEAPNGILIIYSAGVNQSAIDYLGPDDRSPNGLFTRKLLPVMREPGLRLDEAVRRIRHDVSTSARTVGAEQNPAIYDQTDGDFYFVPGPAAAPPPPPVQASLPPPPAPAGTDKEMVFWQTIGNSADPADFEAYLRQFPNGVFADLARTRIGTLMRERTASSPLQSRADVAPSAAVQVLQQQAAVGPNARETSPSLDPTGGRFSGEWKGSASSVTRSGVFNKGDDPCKDMDVKLTVAGDRVSGQEVNVRGRVAVAGTISADGSAQGTMGAGQFSGRFEGNQFKGSFQGGGCSIGTVLLERVR